jgi:hypothetical protein
MLASPSRSKGSRDEPRREAARWLTHIWRYNRYVWAASPGWGGAWDSALAGHPDDPAYEPGRDPAVITDGMILATVQQLGGTAPAGQEADEES